MLSCVPIFPYLLSNYKNIYDIPYAIGIYINYLIRLILEIC